ncbi:MAG: phenylalanine--tRNA ligase subunit alpha [Candidatus Omnitrophota bacterium]|nr:phenylalanine--tRNA ligase subunit alpha [Candidatus Omnitrophota bacterium]MDZ4242183.1 phenylalanine--tRNA ligase subunit alpha [Candidatus Omnitrophota bacterium]
MSWNFEQITLEAENDVQSAADPKGLEAVRVKYLGRKGLLPQIYAALAEIPEQDRPLAGKKANEFRASLTRLLDEKKKELESAPVQGAAAGGRDVTLPGVAAPLGHKHVLTQTIEEICRIFEGMGFAVQEGPEIETEFNNFTALNIPVDHPSRDAFDTFYLQKEDPSSKGRSLLLRSQTSPGQIRAMQAHKPPLAVVIPGKVYRPDAVDATHSFMFHQIEGLLVDKDVKFSDLKGLLTVFCHRFFGENIKMRFRPHFFPFTEPSAEVDISCDFGLGKGASTSKKWLEIMGCGMVHPRVFEHAGYPKGKYSGLAFGMGVERIAMLKHGITDIRLFFENDVRFLKQF